MIQRHLQLRGVVDPDELFLLQKVFDEVCRVKNISPDGERAADCARRIFALYEAGIRDPQELREMLTGN